ncbi:TIM barrel protein [archaeon]|nr:TIM barrel protein [archaeon]
MEKQLIDFGPAGTPASAAPHTILGGMDRIKKLGLDCNELEFTYSVVLDEEAARKVKAKAESNCIKLSVHAPYFVNLNSVEKQKIEASKKRILKAAVIGQIAGARIVCFHPGFYGKDSRQQALENVMQELEDLVERFKEKGLKIKIGLETTGKGSQFGTVEEILELSKLKNVVPYIDFSHVHARGNGCLKSIDDFLNVLKKARQADKELLEGLFMHVSGIEYTIKGERRHLNLAESDFNYKALLQALHELKVKGNIICESPNLEADALLLKKHYLGLLE